MQTSPHALRTLLPVAHWHYALAPFRLFYVMHDIGKLPDKPAMNRFALRQSRLPII